MLCRKPRHSAEFQRLSRVDGIAYCELSRVDETENVTRIRHVDGLAVAAEEAICARCAQLLSDAAVRQHHVLFEAARAYSHERDSIAVPRIHVRLNLEDEAAESIVGGVHHARIARARGRRRRQLDERLKKRLEAEVRQRAAEEYRSLNADQIFFYVEVGSSRSDDIERLAEMCIDVFANHLAGGRIVERRHVDGRAVLPLRLAFVEMQHLALDVVHTAKVFCIANGPVDGSRCDAQGRLDVVHQRQRVFGGPVELVDERQDGQPMTPANLVELSRLRLDAVRGVDHHHDTVGGNERAVRVFAEVLVAGGIEERHATTLDLELERG